MYYIYTNKLKQMLRKYIYLFLILISVGSLGQTTSNLNLNKQITAFNDQMQYEKSIAILTKITSNEATDSYDKYYAFLLKPHTYKRLFNYPKTLKALDDAYEIGIKTDKKDAVRNIILAEKSFIYFDTQNYKKAIDLMNELAKVNYKFIDLKDKCWILMQEGFILYLDKKYAEADKKYDTVLTILSKLAPYQLPNVYGKKIELYNEMKLFDKRDLAFKNRFINCQKI